MKRRNPHGRFLARTCRAVAILLIPILLWTSGPVSAWTATSPNALAAHGPSHPASAAQTPTRVNRVVPTVAAPPLWPVFSLLPTIAEIRNARVFEEPLIPMGGRRSLLENRALAQALKAYAQAGDTENVSMFTAFLDRYPKSIWRASLLTNLGMVYRRTGYFSKALAALEEAWKLSRNEMGAEAHALADRAVGELADLLARLGHDQRLEALLAEINGRDIGGPATERISLARRALWTIRHSPEEAFHCGPYALSRIHAALQADTLAATKLLDARASGQGMSLAELNVLAGTAQMKFQMAKRAPGARILLPALIHWKQNHYGALIKEDNGRYLLQDTALDHASGGELWIRPDVIDSEASGYFLVPEGALPKGWQPVSQPEGERVWGRGATDDDDPDETGCGDHKTGCSGG